jgi:hypothetical protein
MSRMLKVVSPGDRKNSWYWEVLSAADGHIIACGLAYDRTAAVEQANRVKAAAENPPSKLALCLLPHQ